MAIRAEQLDVVRFVIGVVTVDVMQLNGNFASGWIDFAPTACFTTVATKMDQDFLETL